MDPLGGEVRLEKKKLDIVSVFKIRLRESLDEALVQEELIGEKMEKAQILLESIKDAVSKNWQSMITEDELLTKVERMEVQLIDKLGQDKVQELETR